MGSLIRLMRPTGIILFVVLFVFGCASHPQLPPGTAAPVDSEYKYIIGPGDVLEIFVWGYSELNATVPVRPDGKMTTRLVEDLVASGKTPSELARILENEYESFVFQPAVSVTVSNFVGSANQQVKVVGGGTAPRTVPYRNDMTLLDAMIETGGIGPNSAGNRSVLVRKEEGESKTYGVRLNDLLNKADISANVKLLPGDIIMIPQSLF